jgi:hypothetical protein
MMDRIGLGLGYLTLFGVSVTVAMTLFPGGRGGVAPGRRALAGLGPPGSGAGRPGGHRAGLCGGPRGRLASRARQSAT